MKHYITVATALLLSAVLIFNPAANAASVTVSYSTPSSVYANLISVYYPELDETGNPVGNYVLATYEFSFSPQLIFSSYDGYLNGQKTGVFNIYANIPSGGNAAGINISYTPISGSNVFSSGYLSDVQLSNCQFYISTYFNDYTAFGTILRLNTVSGTVSYYFPYTGSNAPDPTQYITISITNATSYGNVDLSIDPLNTGMAGIISYAIKEAINDQSLPFDDILLVLEDIRNQDQTAYTQIVAYLSDNDTFNSTLYTWLTTVLEDNFTDLLDDTTYISSVLNAARNLINSMNSRDSLYYPIFETALDLANTRLQTLINLMSETPAEAASMENAINQMESKQAAINDYSLPAAGNIMGNANSYVNQGTAGMNLLATILNQPLYILILMTVISMAFVSYLLYGKGV